MALRALHTRANENVNVTRLPHGKVLQRMDIKPRTALGTIGGGNSVLDRHAPGKVGVKKAFAVPTQTARVKATLSSHPPHFSKPTSTLSTHTSHPPQLSEPTSTLPTDTSHPPQLSKPTSTLPTHTRQPPTPKPKPPSPQDVFPEPEEMEMEVGQITSALSQQLVIEDIDESDHDNPQLCSEYVKEIYEYMRQLEGKYHVQPDYMSKQSKVNAKMRAILIDWLIQVHLRFKLLQETLYLTVSVIDRYLQSESCDKSQLQLVGVTAMLIASKYEEMYAPAVEDFVYITDETYSSEDICSMERRMLKVLDYSFGNPLCLHFLRRYSRAGNAGPMMHTMAKFLLELSLTDYRSLQFLPSQLAAGALYIARKICGDEEWTPTLHHYSTYSKSQLLPCARRLARLVSNMATSKQRAVYDKYSGSKFLKVATDLRLHSQIIRDLAVADSTQ